MRTRSRSVLPAFPCNVDVCKRKAARPRAIEAPGSRERGSSRRIAIRRRERLCFEGAPQILPPLAQDAAKRVPEPIESEAVDSRRVTPPLTEYDRHRVVEAKTASTNALTKAATEIRVRHDKKLADKVSQRFDIPEMTALRLVQARHRGAQIRADPYGQTDPNQGIRTMSPASQLLWPRPTSHARASSATAPRLPDADRRTRERTLNRRPDVGYPRFRRNPFARDVLLDPGGMTVPRITALHMLRSTITTVSAPANSSFRGSIPHPMQSLCTLRKHCRQWPRNTRYQVDATP